MKTIDLTLPEWAFLDGNSHLGNSLEGRTVLQHIRSYTMLEVFSEDEVTTVLKPSVKTRSFTYKNSFGIEERHIMVVHFSLAEHAELDSILDKAVDFYCKYLAWEDSNIATEIKSQEN